MKIAANKEITPNLRELWYGQMIRFMGSGPACPKAEDYPLKKTLVRHFLHVLPDCLDINISPVVVPWDSRHTER